MVGLRMKLTGALEAPVFAERRPCLLIWYLSTINERVIRRLREIYSLHRDPR